MRADEMVIYSDFDGTIASGPGMQAIVCSENIEAIKSFIKAGGKFGMASGRNHQSIDTLIGEEIFNIYNSTGIKTILYSSVTGEGVDEIYSLLPNKITAFIGNSGVGKSTLLNKLFPDFRLKTGEVSDKLGRGRHTTRTVELLKFNGGYVCDTPGFSTMQLEKFNIQDKTQLQYMFPEFEDYIGQCKFTSCSHTCEKGCAILQMVEGGKIQKSRHNSYVDMYNEIKDIK